MTRQVNIVTMRGIYVFCLIFFCTFYSKSQNLVYNGDFELYDRRPLSSELMLGNCQIHLCKGWDACCPKQYDSCGSSDYHYYPASFTSKSWVQPKRPYKGNAFVGYFSVARDFANKEKLAYEYISGHLIKPLEVGKRYKVSLAHTNGEWRVHDNKAEANDAFGILFSTHHPVQTEYFEIIHAKPQLRTPYLMSDSMWRIMQFEFVADSAYTNITFGCFWTYNEINFLTYKIGNDPLLYIDDLRVEPLIEIPELPEPRYICTADSIYIENKTKKPVKWWVDNILVDSGSGFKYYYNKNVSKVIAESYGEYDTTYVYIVKKPLVQLISEGDICPWQDKKGLVHFMTEDSLSSFHWLISGKTVHDSLLAVSHSGTARFIYYSPLACQWQTEIELEENCEELYPCYFPNSFSPNYDNLNDTYRIECENIIEFEMSIFNRWGEQIYTSNNPSQTWDGTYKGMACPTGIYFATIKLEIPSQDGNIRSKIQKISIHLVR